MSDKKSDKQWSLVLENNSRLFDFKLKELREYKDLLFLLVKRDYLFFYKQTILGPVWFFLQPLLTTITFVLIFKKVAGLSTDNIPAPLFYMVGVVAWNYFADCLVKTSGVFKDNANVFGKVYFPRLIIPLSIVISNLVKFGVQLILLVLMIIYYAVFGEYDFQFDVHLLLFPFLILMMALLGLALGMIISALTTKYRDLAFLVTFGVQLLMYATPVIYPLKSAPEKIRDIISLNPLSPVIEGLRLGILGKGDFDVSSFMYSVGITLVLLFIGVLVFNRTEKNFIDTV